MSTYLAAAAAKLNVFVFNDATSIRWMLGKISAMNKFDVLLTLLSTLVKFTHSLSDHPIVVVFGFDGFGVDYIHHNENPFLEALGKRGVKADYMENIYPTKTFPNFFTIATGLYAETHGVLSNKVFNEKGECMKYSDELFHYNEDIIPIWTLNELHDERRHSGCMMYPGSEFAYRGVNCTYSVKYDPNVDWKKRVDQIVNWLMDDRKPANLVMAYFEQPDATAHHYSWNSTRLRSRLQRIDQIIEYFLVNIVKMRIWERVNYVVLSDHGMAEIKVDQFINVTALLQPATYTQCGNSPALQILPKPGYEDHIYENLTRASEKLRTFQVYKNKDKIPESWHWANNRRNIGFYVVANPPHTFDDSYDEIGNHGFPPSYPPMRAIFYADGPLFQRGVSTHCIRNIDIYPFFVQLMDMRILKDQIVPNGTAVGMNKFRSRNNK